MKCCRRSTRSFASVAVVLLQAALLAQQAAPPSSRSSAIAAAIETAVRARLGGEPALSIVQVSAVRLPDDADAEALWAAANLEEDWQAEQWGQDSLAQERRAKRLRDFANAMRFAELARAG